MTATFIVAVAAVVALCLWPRRRPPASLEGVWREAERREGRGGFEG